MDPRKGMGSMASFYGIDEVTAEFFFGPRVKEFRSVTHEGRVTEPYPRHSRWFKHVDTYEVVRHGETEWVEVSEGDGHFVDMSEGTEFDIVITDHGSEHSRSGHKRRYKVEVVKREVRVGRRDDRKVVVTADFDSADGSPATVHRTAIRLVLDRFPVIRTEAHSGVPVTS